MSEVIPEKTRVATGRDRSHWYQAAFEPPLSSTEIDSIVAGGLALAGQVEQMTAENPPCTVVKFSSEVGSAGSVVRRAGEIAAILAETRGAIEIQPGVKDWVETPRSPIVRFPIATAQE